MKCTSPPALEDSQLLAYLDGEADEAVGDHLAQCHFCSQRAGALDKVQKKLTARLYRVDCPPPEALGEYHLGMLATDQRVSVARHLRTCPHCRLELGQLKNYLSELAPPTPTGPLEQVKVLVARLIGQGEAYTATGSPAFAPAYAALRGGSEGPITMEANGVLIVLDPEPGREGSVTIQGQVAADDQERWTGARVEAHQEGEVRMTAIVDELGAFRLEALQPGPTELHLIPASGAMVVVKIDAKSD